MTRKEAGTAYVSSGTLTSSPTWLERIRANAKLASDPITTVRTIVIRPMKKLLPNWCQKSSTSQYPWVKTVEKLWSDGSGGQMLPANSISPSSGSSAINSMLYTGVSDQIKSTTTRVTEATSTRARRSRYRG